MEQQPDSQEINQNFSEHNEPVIDPRLSLAVEMTLAVTKQPKDDKNKITPYTPDTQVEQHRDDKELDFRLTRPLGGLATQSSMPDAARQYASLWRHRIETLTGMRYISEKRKNKK